jgi:ABC-type glycerol-3-phosphate transport system substrate-binding protein
MPGEKLYMGFVHPAEWMASNGGSWVDPKTWRPQLNSKSMLETLDYLQKLNKFQSQGWSGQKYLDTQAALATGKISMSYLSGARAIGYIEKYAPENMRDPEHFMPMLRPHGPSGKVGISALDGENWAVFSQSKYPTESFEFLRIFYKKENYMQYCHSVPIHLSPIFKSMLGDPAYLANERIKKWKAWHDVMMTGLSKGSFLPLGFSRPEDNLLPFLAELDGSSIVADMVVEVMEGGKNPKAEADRAQKRSEELLTQLGHKRWS